MTAVDKQYFERIREHLAVKDYCGAIQYIAKILSLSEHLPLEKVQEVKENLAQAVLDAFFSSNPRNDYKEAPPPTPTDAFESKRISFHELLRVRKAKTKTIYLKRPVDSVKAAKVAIDGDDVYLMSFIVEEPSGNKKCLCLKRFDNLPTLLEAVRETIDKKMYIKV